MYVSDPLIVHLPSAVVEKKVDSVSSMHQLNPVDFFSLGQRKVILLDNSWALDGICQVQPNGGQAKHGQRDRQQF